MAVMEEDHDSKHLYMGSVQMANLMVSTGMPQQAWSLILGQKTNSTAPSYSIIHLPKANMVVFSCPFKGAHVNQDLSSLLPAAPVFETIRDKNHPLGFLIGKNNPTISISSLILSIFNYLLQSTNLKDELVALLCKDSPQLILVGQSLGGSIAALFTIWGLKARDASSPLPLSITFGAPLIGDSSLHVAIKKVPQWTSRFWNILAHDDVVPYMFLAKRHRQAAPLVPRREEDFRSFGLYLLCSGFGFACVDDPELVLKIMDVWRTDLSIQHVINAKDYGATLELVQRVILYQSKSLSSDYDSGLTADIRLMLDGIGMDNEFSVRNAREIERKAQDEDHRMPSIIDQVKKLHNFKKYRLMLEWYKKDSENRGKDYYDSFKSRSTTKDMDPIKYKNILDRYWSDVVEEAENRPQSDRVPLRDLFLLGGNHDRRVVEPLHIALHYRKGDSRNYMAEGVRPHHFVMLEKWLKEYSLVKGPKDESRHTIVVYTEDSCFWAHVEEARKDLQLVKAGGIEEEESRENLKVFEAYMIKLVRNKSVSSAVFFERGTFMTWWRDYQQILESCYESDLTRYMENREYVQYK